MAYVLFQEDSEKDPWEMTEPEFQSEFLRLWEKRTPVPASELTPGMFVVHSRKLYKISRLRKGKSGLLIDANHVLLGGILGEKVKLPGIVKERGSPPGVRLKDSPAREAVYDSVPAATAKFVGGNHKNVVEWAVSHGKTVPAGIVATYSDPSVRWQQVPESERIIRLYRVVSFTGPRALAGIPKADAVRKDAKAKANSIAAKVKAMDQDDVRRILQDPKSGKAKELLKSADDFLMEWAEALASTEWNELPEWVRSEVLPTLYERLR